MDEVDSRSEPTIAWDVACIILKMNEYYQEGANLAIFAALAACPCFRSARAVTVNCV